MPYGYSDIIQITGLVEVQAKLTAFGEKVANQVTQKALNEGANLIKNEAKELVPEWEGRVYKNGKIDLTHLLKVKGASEGGRVKEGYKRLWAGNLKLEIRARNIRKVQKGMKQSQVYVKLKEAWYAKFVEGTEFGTSRQVAKPFMRPAFENKKEEAVSLFEKYINEEIVNGRL